MLFLYFVPWEFPINGQTNKQTGEIKTEIPLK